MTPNHMSTCRKTIINYLYSTILYYFLLRMFSLAFEHVGRRARRFVYSSTVISVSTAN